MIEYHTLAQLHDALRAAETAHAAHDTARTYAAYLVAHAQYHNALQVNARCADSIRR